jgi:hypothetical protein
MNSDIDSGVGMVGVIDRDIDRLIHRDVSSRCPPGQGERGNSQNFQTVDVLLCPQRMHMLAPA